MKNDKIPQDSLPTAYYDGYQAAYTGAFCPYFIKDIKNASGRHSRANICPYAWWHAGKADGEAERARNVLDMKREVRL